MILRFNCRRLVIHCQSGQKSPPFETHYNGRIFMHEESHLIINKLMRQYTQSIVVPTILCLIAILCIRYLVQIPYDKFEIFLSLPGLLQICGIWILILMTHFFIRVSRSALIKDLILTPIDLNFVMRGLISRTYFRVLSVMMLIMAFWIYEVFISNLIEERGHDQLGFTYNLLFNTFIPLVIIYLYIHCYIMLLNIAILRIYEFIFSRKFFNRGNGLRIIWSIIGLLIYPFWPIAFGYIILNNQKPSHVNGPGAALNGMGVIFMIIFWIFILSIVIIAIVAAHLRYLKGKIYVFEMCNQTHQNI